MTKRTVIAIIGAIAILALLTGCGGGSSNTATPTVTVTETTPADNSYDSSATDTSSGFTSAEQGFLDDVHSMNNSIIEGNTDASIVETGHTVCDTLDGGYTVTDITENLLSSGDYQTDNQRGFLATMIAGAVVNLCPEYYSQITD
jgi:hypothetical protein